MRRLLFLGCALLACSCKKEQAVVPYAGKSAHWNQQAVPISLQCAACHAKEFEEWAASDHAWAWRGTDSVLDAEPFHGQRLKAHGSELSFLTDRQGGLLLRDEQSGKSFSVHSVLGRTPLVQYLVRGEDGGLHTPSAAWDTVRHEWFDMFEDDARLAAEGSATRTPGDWGHWLGRGMNWNSQCAWCHMSGFRKNYDEKADRYASAWQEPGVSCIQCHKLASAPDPANGCMIARSDQKLSARQVHDNCASCHARREELDGQFHIGDKFDDHFRLELPIIEGIFWPNGMQRDEDYCETGLRLSKMGAAGVTCLDCHDPHTAKLKLPQEDNSLCLRCHGTGRKTGQTASPVIDPATHAPARAGGTEPACVDCHMPESPYMARDFRRDHSFNSPDPILSMELGMPNACTRCHQDKDTAWAAEALRRTWPEQKAEASRARTRAVAAALSGNGNAADLIAACRAEKVPAWRAALLELLARLPETDETLQLAREAARDADPLPRAAAARILGSRAPELLRDPVRLVRHAAAWSPAGNLAALPPGVAKELEETARFQADQPTGAMQFAMLAEAHGRHDEAERQYRRAIALDPASYVAYMDYAVFLARRERPLDALSQMLACVKIAPGNAEAFYRLGLLLAEIGQYETALNAFDKALRLAPGHAAARHNRRLLLQSLGREAEGRQESHPKAHGAPSP